MVFNLVKEGLAGPNDDTVRSITAPMLDDTVRPPCHGECLATTGGTIGKYGGRVSIEDVVEKIFDSALVEQLFLRRMLPKDPLELVCEGCLGP